MDGTKREGRFVNAEIGRVAPRREPSADSQSRCERSKEHHGCFTLPVRCVGNVDASRARHRQRQRSALASSSKWLRRRTVGAFQLTHAIDSQKGETGGKKRPRGLPGYCFKREQTIGFV